MTFVTEADALWPGEMISVRVGDRPVLLVNVDGRVHAYLDRCPHQGVRLSAGCLDGGTLTCGAHGWSFDIDRGAGLNPASTRLTPVTVEVREDGIYIEVNDDA